MSDLRGGADMEPEGSLGFSEEGLAAQTRPGQPTVVHLRGEIDIAQSHALRRLLADALAAHPRVVVDMTDTTFVDGSVVGVLAQANARSGDNLRVQGASGIVARVFELTDLAHLLV